MASVKKSKMTDEERQKLIKKLNKETEEFIQQKLEKNKDYKYTDGFTVDNVEEICATHPAFMQKQPTQEEIDNNPMLQALQAIQYDDPEDTPEEKALELKKDGNFQYKCKKFKRAYAAYTEALRNKFDNTELRSTLFFNRSAANYQLENFRSSLHDANEAVKLNPDYVKAVVKCAQCCSALKRYQDAMDWSKVLLSLDADNTIGNQIYEKSKNSLQIQKRDQRKNEHEKEKQRQAKKSLITAIKQRGIQLSSISKDAHDNSDEEEDSLKLSEFETLNVSKSMVHLDDKGSLIWPVMFVYPEFKTTDFIEEFHETSIFLDHLSIMFEQQPDWDTEQHYKLENLEVYYENRQTENLHKVTMESTLLSVLKEKSMVVQAGTANFIILSRTSKFYDYFMSKHNVIM
uniref:Tetratricopeptide repeat protein 4-like n=1 Tax=Phallusia mammillata TaxID=59560 RepID=A0A6F9DV75_9ASCI|nr:tetratricopeptide repeat protein 4-like [Phallusia mammillata]